MMPNPAFGLLAYQPFTATEIAGLAFGVGILAAAAAAPRMDEFIAINQRR